MNHWYEMAVTPMPQVPLLCEALENQGWEVVSSFNTGMLAQAGSILDPKRGMQPNAVPIVAVVCRRPRVNGDNERPRLVRPGEAAQENSAMAVNK